MVDTDIYSGKKIKNIVGQMEGHGPQNKVRALFLSVKKKGRE